MTWTLPPGYVMPGTSCRALDCRRQAWERHPATGEPLCHDHYVEADAGEEAS